MSEDKKLRIAKVTCLVCAVLAVLTCSTAGAVWWAVDSRSDAVKEAMDQRNRYMNTAAPASQSFGQTNSSVCF